jgi:hypothetical protein
MGTHTSVVATGSMIHVNNPSATKLEGGAGGADWLMAYTQDKPQDGGQVNKPGISWSSDGVNFVPKAGGESFITVTGYPHNWTRADVNGKETTFLRHFYTNATSYQDRLGTNIGKTPKKSGVTLR